jgi:hypothetical protein
MNDEFRALDTLARWARYLGWVLLMAGGVGLFLGFVWAVKGERDDPDLFGKAAVAFGVGGFGVIGGFALTIIGEWTGVFFAIEKNTRATSQHFASGPERRMPEASGAGADSGE